MIMKRYSTLLVFFLAAMMIVASCHKNNENDPEPTPEPTPVEAEKDFHTVPLTITVNIAPSNGTMDGITLKQTFAKGDVIVITNPDVLYEPLTLSADDSDGKSSADLAARISSIRCVF
ncbi:MAG: hypothetical protein II956_16335 [Bacteroidales bacterium]|nr:hypothetical protein [Bacteroidales bacterium]